MSKFIVLLSSMVVVATLFSMSLQMLPIPAPKSCHCVVLREVDAPRRVRDGSLSRMLSITFFCIPEHIQLVSPPPLVLLGDRALVPIECVEVVQPCDVRLYAHARRCLDELGVQQRLKASRIEGREVSGLAQGTAQPVVNLVSCQASGWLSKVVY